MLGNWSTTAACTSQRQTAKKHKDIQRYERQTKQYSPALAEHSRDTKSTITSVRIFTFISALPSGSALVTCWYTVVVCVCGREEREGEQLSEHWARERDCLLPVSERSDCVLGMSVYLSKCLFVSRCVTAPLQDWSSPAEVLLLTQPSSALNLLEVSSLWVLFALDNETPWSCGLSIIDSVGHGKDPHRPTSTHSTPSLRTCLLRAREGEMGGGRGRLMG